MEVTRDRLAMALKLAGLDGRERSDEIWAMLGGEPDPLRVRLTGFLWKCAYFPSRQSGHLIEPLATALIVAGLVRLPAQPAGEVAGSLRAAGIRLLREDTGRELTRNQAEQELIKAGVPDQG